MQRIRTLEARSTKPTIYFDNTTTAVIWPLNDTRGRVIVSNGTVVRNGIFEYDQLRRSVRSSLDVFRSFGCPSVTNGVHWVVREISTVFSHLRGTFIRNLSVRLSSTGSSDVIYLAAHAPKTGNNPRIDWKPNPVAGSFLKGLRHNKI